MVDFERKYNEARQVVQEFLNKQGQDKCHYYPELFAELAKIFDVQTTAKPKLPPRSEFEEGCRKYQDEIYNPKIPNQDNPNS